MQSSDHLQNNSEETLLGSNALQVAISTIQILIEMDESKKILICRSCNFFPTKADAQQFIIEHEEIVWECRACQTSNVYPKKWLVSLLSTNYITVSPSSLAPKYSEELKQDFVAVIEMEAQKEQCFYSQLKQKLLGEYLGQDFLQDFNLEELNNKSVFLSILKQIRKALNKFENKPLNQHLEFQPNDYKIYLLELYLNIVKEQMYRKALIINSCLKIVLKANNRVFVFCFDNLEVQTQISSIQHLLLIYQLFSRKHIASWIVNYYGKILKNYEGQLVVQKTVKQMLILGKQSHKIQLIKQPSKHKLQLVGKTNPNEEIENLTQCFDQFPISDNSFMKYLKQRKVHNQRQTPNQFIEVFFKQRRKSNIQKYSHPSNLNQFKDILLGRKFNISSQEQAQLKSKLIKVVQEMTLKSRLQLIKIVGYFCHNGVYLAVLFVFNWSKIESEQLSQSLEEPESYNHTFKQDVLAEVYPVTSKSKVNPFSKKSIYEINCTYQNGQEESDQFISL